LPAVSLKLRRRGGEMGVRVNDHDKPPRNSNRSNRSSRSTVTLRSKIGENESQKALNLRLSVPSRFAIASSTECSKLLSLYAQENLKSKFSTI
jgi:hypothetical protein